MTYTYTPRGVCSQRMEFELDGDRIVSLRVIGGCDGNLKGLSSLLAGMPVDEAIARLSGIRCGCKNTSCPDQIARALRQYRDARA